MKCEFCGNEIAENSKFCEKCGARVEVAKAPAPVPPVVSDVANSASAVVGNVSDVAKNLPKEQLIKFGGIAVAAIVVIVVLFNVLGGLFQSDNFTANEDLLIRFTYEDDHIEVINSNGKSVELDTEEVYRTATNFDGSAMLVLDYDGVLYLIADAKEVEIAEDVSSYAISDDGSYIAYIVEDDGEYTVCYYSVSKDEALDVEETEDKISALALSPDGKTLAYTTYADGEYTAYLVEYGKDAEKFEKNSYIYALSDSAKYIYYVDTDDMTFFVRTGDEDEKLAADAGDMSYIYYNVDYTECLYVYGGVTYISVKGGEKTKLVSDSFYGLVAPAGITAKSMGNSSYHYNISTFKETFAVLGDDIAYISKKYELEKIDDTSAVQLLSDNSSIIYQDGSDFVKYTSKDLDDPAKEYETDGYPITWVSSDDGKIIYFVNDDQELFYTKGENDPEKIADDVASIVMIPGTTTVFFLMDYSNDSGVLYYSANGKDKVKVDGGGDVTMMAVYGDEIIYLANYDTDDGFEVYTMTSKGKSTLLAEEVIDVASSDLSFVANDYYYYW